MRLCDFADFVRTLDLGLDIVDGVRGLNLEGDSLTRKGLDEDLHLDEGLRWVSEKLTIFCAESS